MIDNRLLKLALLALGMLMSGANCIFSNHRNPRFDTIFSDSTLRLDYIFSGKESESSISLRRQIKTPGWYGRRVNTDSLYPAASGRVTMVSQTGDTIYSHSFSSLYLEWIDTDEKTQRAFEHVVQIPAPKQPTFICAELYNKHHQPFVRHSFLHNPEDILINRPDRASVDLIELYRGDFSGDKIAVTLLSEGYRQNERDSFVVHAKTAVEQILHHSPFHEFKDRFDFMAVFIPSKDSGISVPRLGLWKDTAFKSHYSTFYSDRYLTCEDLFSLHDQITGLPAHHLIILANSDEYGGGGIFNSYTLTTSCHKDFKPVVVHEFGHSFGGLADEYFYDNDVMIDTYPLDVEPWEANITTLVDFKGKWESLLTETNQSDKNAGLFEGGGYSAKGIYRAAQTCRMRTNQADDFCPACVLAIRRMIEFLTGKVK